MAAKKWEFLIIDNSLYKMPLGTAAQILNLATLLNQAQNEFEKTEDFYDIEQQYINAINELKKQFPPIQKEIFFIATI
jgi:5'(3')-deoxyribonucleotidase